MKTKASVLIVVCVAFLLPSSVHAQAFWHGVDIVDSGMAPEDMVAIHEAIVYAMTDLAPTPTGFPNGDNVNDDHRGLRIYEPDEAWSGYTLLNCFTPTGTDPNGNNVLIDMEGNVINAWMIPGQAYFSAAKPLPGGCIQASWVYPGSEGGGKLTQLNWDGEIVKQWDTNSHHDHEREGSPCGYYAPGFEPMIDGGKVLVLESTRPDPNETTHISVKFIKDDRIRELDYEGNELFRWQAWEHFEELGLDAWAEAGLDLGLNYEGPGFLADILPEDWSHGNAVAWCGPNRWYNQGDLRFHPDNIIADFRSLNITIIIARHDHPDGEWAAGDIVWQLGPDYSTAGNDYMVGQIIGQHQAHIIPKDLPGGGNMLIFDNGGAAGYGALIEGLRDADGNPLGSWPNKFRMFSRVLDINPVTKQVVWEFKQPRLSEDLDGDGRIVGNEKLFFSNLMSGMQRLPNGNTLICEADPGRIFEVTMSGKVVWEFAPPWLRAEGMFGGAVYRAYRIPSSWIPAHSGASGALEHDVPVAGLYGVPGSERFYQIEVPDCTGTLVVRTSGGTGNCDVYLKRGAKPTASNCDFALCQPATNESISIGSPQAGTWHILVQGQSNYFGATLEAEIWP